MSGMTFNYACSGNDASDSWEEKRKEIDALLKKQNELREKQTKEREEKRKLDEKKRQEEEEQEKEESKRLEENTRQQILEMFANVRELVFTNSLGCSKKTTAEIKERLNSAAGIKVIPNKSLPAGTYFLSLRIKDSGSKNEVLLETDLRQLSRTFSSVKSSLAPWKGFNRFCRFSSVVKRPITSSAKNVASLAAIDEFIKAVKDARAGIPPKPKMLGTSTD